MAEETCDVAKVIEPNQMINFNAWANEAEKDDNRNVKTALKMIKKLTDYAFRFCDAGQVAQAIDRLASEQING